MTLTLQWGRQPVPAIQTRWRGQVRMPGPPSPREPLPALAAIVGPPGRDADSLIQRFEAAEAIGGHRVVYIDATDRARLATPQSASAMSPAGLTTNAAAIGGMVAIRSAGIMAEDSWDWLPGPVYLGPAGTLVQQPPSSGAIYQVGVSVGPNRIRFIPLLVAQLT